MRASPVLLAIVAALTAGCASGTPDTGPDLGVLADQAERVGQLVEEDRPCEAAEAARTLATLAERDGVEQQVRQAVVSFASSAEASITCDPDATPTDTSSPRATTDDAPAGDGDEDDQGEGDEGDGEGKDGDGEGNEGEGNEGEGNDGEGKPGRGKGRDNGNGNGDD